MNLKTILAALLPFESREHVLGDLEERGFRFGDLADVLPRVWWSYWVRQWNGPFVAAAVSDAALRHRALQFARRRSFFWAVARALVIVWGSSWLHPVFSHRHASTEPLIDFLVCVAFGVLFYRVLGERNAPPPGDRDAWITHHRKQLTNALWGLPFQVQFPIRLVARFLWVSYNVVLFDMLFWPGPTAPGDRWIIRTALILQLVLVFLWERRRQHLLQAELAQLSSIL